MYEQFLVLPSAIHMIVDSYGGLWPFVNSSNVTPDNADTISKFLAEVLVAAEQSPETLAVAAFMLSYLRWPWQFWDIERPATIT